MTQATPTLEDRVLDLVAEVCATPRDKLRLDDQLRADLRMDSVSSMELVSMMCEEFDIDVELDEAMAVDDVAGAIALVRRYQHG